MAGSSTAQASLGVLYALGSGVKKDLVESYKWLTIASLNGNKAAAIQAAVESPVGNACTASALQNHPNVTFLLDPAAASLLTKH